MTLVELEKHILGAYAAETDHPPVDVHDGKNHPVPEFVRHSGLLV